MAWLFSRILLAWLLVLPGLALGQGADGEFSERRSEHFVLLQDVDIDQRVGRQGSTQFEREVLGVLEEAHDRVDELLGIRPRGRVQVLVYDPQLFDREFQGVLPFSVAGFYHGVVRVRGATRVEPSLVAVLNHEYVHAAFDGAAPGVRITAWVNEGTAEWVAQNALQRRRLDSELRSALQEIESSGSLLALRDMSGTNFGSLTGEEIGLAYAQSYALIEYLVDHRGEITFRQFLQRLMSSGDVARALRNSYSLDLDELERDFAAHLRER